MRRYGRFFPLSSGLACSRLPWNWTGKKALALSRSEKASELAKEAARQSIVLLRNDQGLLPLKKGQHKTIAVIGPNAKVCRLGNYSGRPLSTVSLYDGLKSYLGSETEVLFAQGCRIAHNDTNDSYANWRYVNEVEYATVEDNRQLIEEAKKSQAKRIW